MVPSISQLSTAVLWYKYIFSYKKICLYLRGKQNKIPLIIEGNE